MFEEHIGRLKLLHAARQRSVENKVKKKELFAEHADFFAGMDLADEALNHIAEDVRREALILYKMIPNMERTGIPGITIRESKVVGYDPSTALEWAIRHQLALQLDGAAYKKLVLSGQAPGSIEVAYTAAIASDLSEFVEEVLAP